MSKAIGPVGRQLLIATVAVLALAFARLGFAQGELSTATLTGQVTDQTGAAVPGAEISLQSKGGGAPYTTVTNGLGYYTVPLVRPGEYTLSATKGGFSKVVIEPVNLEIGRTGTVNVEMKPGKVVQTVTVSSSAVQLETGTSSLGEVTETRTNTQLPVSLRDVTALVNLVPGVTADFRAAPVGDAVALGAGMGSEVRNDYSINGGINQTSVIYVDGVDMTFNCDGFPCSSGSVTPDFAQEMQVLTNNLSAEYGRGAGAVNIVTKSGTNGFHGTGYDFLQNSALNANDWFSNRANQKKPSQRRNQYGYAVGGPIIRDKLWFFSDYEWLHQQRAETVATRVPTAAERAGNFSNECALNGTPITLYNPFSTYVDHVSGATLRNPFPNNQIPANLFDPSGFAGKVMSYYPMPNNPGLLGPGGCYTGQENLFVSAPNPVLFDRLDEKIDRNLGHNLRLGGRWSRSDYKNVPLDAYGKGDPANSGILSQRNYTEWINTVAATGTWTANPTTVLTVSGSLARIHWIAGNRSKGFDPTSLGGPFADGSLVALAKEWDGGPAYPQISPSGYGVQGESLQYDYEYHFATYGAQVGLIKTKGRHTLKTGFQFNMHQLGENFFTGNVGSYGFGGFTTGQNPLVPSAFTGNGLADMELNALGSASFTTGYSDFLTSKYTAVYFQDDIRVTPKLTLNLGLRYEIEPPYSDRYNHLGRFDHNATQPIGDLVGPNTGGVSLNQYFINLGQGPLEGAVLFPSSSQNHNGRGVAPTDSKDFGPRVGYAYRISDKLVARGGFSRLYMASLGSAGLVIFGGYGQAITSSAITTVDGINPLPGVFSQPFPNSIQQPTYDRLGDLTQVGFFLNGAQDNNVTPYQWQYNQGFEYQMPWDGLLSVVYAGSRSKHLSCPYIMCTDQTLQSANIQFGPHISDQVPNPFFGIITDPRSRLSLPTIPRSQLYQEFPEFNGWQNFLYPWQGPTNDNFKGDWDALEVGYTKHFTKSISMNVAYTLSKNITNAGTFEAGFLGPAVGYNNQRGDYSNERSLSEQDVTHRLVAAYVWDVPVGRKQRWGSNSNRVLNGVLGGWQVANTLSFSSGFPLGISQTGVTGSGTSPNLVPGVDPCLSSGRPRGVKVLDWVNQSAWSLTPDFSNFGNAPRVFGCRADGVKNLDFSLIKYFPIHENINLQFRSEAFNLFNRVQFGPPNTTVGSGAFGEIVSAYNQPRVIQFALKLSF